MRCVFHKMSGSCIKWFVLPPTGGHRSRCQASRLLHPAVVRPLPCALAAGQHRPGAGVCVVPIPGHLPRKVPTGWPTGGRAPRSTHVQTALPEEENSGLGSIVKRCGSLSVLYACNVCTVCKEDIYHLHPTIGVHSYSREQGQCDSRHY